MNENNLNRTNFLNITNFQGYVNNDSLYINITLEEYIYLKRGPKYLPITIVLPITVIYAALFLSGIIGNLAVCIVIAKNASMHTATNYYLFSLALSDLALLVLGLPNDLSVYWQQYPWMLGLLICKARALVSEMSSYVSVMTIVAFSVERYVAICHPLTSYKTDKLNRVARVIAGLWLVSLVCASPFAVYTTVNYIDYPPGSGIPVNESAFCAMLRENIPSNIPIYEISSFIFFILPAFVLSLLYAMIGKTIRKNRNVEGSVHGERRSSQERKSIVAMLLAVVIAFFICWAPFHMQRLMYIYMSTHPAFYVISMWMYYITGMLYYFSATVNPILYSVMSVRYRKAFKQTLFCKKGRRENDLVGTNSNRESNSKRVTYTKTKETSTLQNSLLQNVE